MTKKVSFYNNLVEIKDMNLLYNSLSNGYLILSNEFKEQLFSNEQNLDNLKRINSNLFQILEDNGFIVNADYDEVSFVNNFRFISNFKSKEYSLIINPSMNCNLKCWYCYENHKEKSSMSLSVANSIVKHVKKQFEFVNFQRLSLSFFGGEPLLNKKIIIYLIDKIKLFCDSNNIKIALSFTTNGTLFNTEFLNYLKPFDVSFQITFDGSKEQHNETRFFKNSKKGSYECILRNIFQIRQSLEQHFLNIRINFNQETLQSICKLIDEVVDVVDKDKTTISLHRIWQVEERSINRDSVLETLKYIVSKGIRANFPYLEIGQPCYADTFNHSVINFDGNVYKCTARDFNEDETEGKLTENGLIMWNLKKRIERHCKALDTICTNCKLLPACPGICTQSCLEQKIPQCHLDNSIFSKKDFIVYNFNKNLVG